MIAWEPMTCRYCPKLHTVRLKDGERIEVCTDDERGDYIEMDDTELDTECEEH